MTQEEKLIARLKTLDPSSLCSLLVYITPDGKIGFWSLQDEVKVEGAEKALPQKTEV